MTAAGGQDPLVQLYGAAAIYAVTFCDEETVRRHQAHGQWAGPVEVPPLRPALPAPEEEARPACWGDCGEAAAYPAATPADLGCDDCNMREDAAEVAEASGAEAPPPARTASALPCWCEDPDRSNCCPLHTLLPF